MGITILSGHKTGIWRSRNHCSRRLVRGYPRMARPDHSDWLRLVAHVWICAGGRLNGILITTRERVGLKHESGLHRTGGGIHDLSGED
jgi:hypothetical protein